MSSPPSSRKRFTAASSTVDLIPAYQTWIRAERNLSCPAHAL